jgi:2-oxoisovalerate dehydrogenase E1 component alpha subunit
MSCDYEDNWVQYISAEGRLTADGREAWKQLSDQQKIDFYRWMTFVRLFDRKLIVLQRQGRIGTYAPVEGQEAAQVGSALALTSQDWIFPSYREHGVALTIGFPLTQILLYWAGRVEGCKPVSNLRYLPPSVPIATQIPHAVGAAWAAKLKKEQTVAVAYFGDGATSEGDFHEGCNFAGVFQLPVILFCQNNGYAISVPFSRQSAAKTVAERAAAYRFPGIRVDGNDILAVYMVMKQAVKRAREGRGPTLIEAVTYRKGPHTTADDPSRYREIEEAKYWSEQRDPLTRYQLLLRRFELLTDVEEEAWELECKQRIEEAIKEMESLKAPPPTHLFAHVFAKPPLTLQKQKLQMMRKVGTEHD